MPSSTAFLFIIGLALLVNCSSAVDSTIRSSNIFEHRDDADDDEDFDSLEAYRQVAVAHQEVAHNDLSVPQRLQIARSIFDWKQQQQNQRQATAPRYTIPVTFHVIHDDDGNGDSITEFMLNKYTKRLNRAVGYRADSAFTFVRSGVPTTRVNDSQLFYCRLEDLEHCHDQLGQRYRVGDATHLNIYFLNLDSNITGGSGFLGGSATIPFVGTPSLPSDGVMVHGDLVRQAGVREGYMDPITLFHEVG